MSNTLSSIRTSGPKFSKSATLVQSNKVFSHPRIHLCNMHTGQSQEFEFSKVTTDSNLTFHQGRQYFSSVFGSGETEQEVLKQ